MRELYASQAQGSMRRLLSLLDRNPVSRTYGCFDRSYWLHRQKDFAASTAQMSVRTLAYFYAHDFPGNDFFRHPSVLSWIEASLFFTLSLQHGDGSYDEWYPNERGWAGPTGYVAHALFETLTLVEKELAPTLVEKVRSSLKLSARHLSLRDEGDILANHFAIALLPLTEIAEESQDPFLLEAAEKWHRRFQDLIVEEGWSLEYDGCDIGYNLGTLNFLADLYQVKPSPAILDYARKSFVFLSHFAYPDGQWAGSLGSRHTLHSYFFALEFWSGHLPEARSLLKHQRESLAKGDDLAPMDQEDHYLHYRLADYIKAGLSFFEGDLTKELLPYEKEGFSSRSFQQAGFWIEKRGDLLLWVASRRGGAFKLFRGTQCLNSNDGVLILDSDQRILTSLWQSSSAESHSPCQISGRLQRVFDRQFHTGSFVAFRIVSVMLGFSWTAYLFKKWIRSKMITPAKTQGPEWTREISWENDHLLVKDRIHWRGPKPQEAYWGGSFNTRYVPQAHYYSSNDLRFLPQKIEWPRRESGGPVQIDAKIGFTDGKADVCVE